MQYFCPDVINLKIENTNRVPLCGPQEQNTWKKGEYVGI